MLLLHMPKLLLIIAASTFLTVTNGSVYLEFDPEFSPPASIPVEGKDLVYSAPENDHMLQPIIVYLRHTSNNSLVSGEVEINATTILASNQNNPISNPGDWFDGELCEHSYWFSRYWFDRYYPDGGIELQCSNGSYPALPNGVVTNLAINGTAEFPRLLHTKYFNQTRRILFLVHYNGVLTSITTNPIRVDLQAAAINITSSIPSTLYVNEPITVTTQTLAVDPNNGNLIPLTEGRHSSLNIELTIGWELKRFYIFFPPSFNLQELKTTEVTLGGRDAKLNGQFDLVIRKRAVLGQATFEDVRITNIYSDVIINITQILPYDPWERWPAVYNDTITWYDNIFFNTNESDYSPATVLSERFDVVATEILALQIDPNSLIDFGANIDANFRMKPDLVVKALDTFGRVITDGLDSNLTVYGEIYPSTACLSNDSSFALENGAGVFSGSVCLPEENVRLRFYTNSTDGTTIYSAWTPLFNVSGVFRIAGIFPRYFDSGLAILYEASAKLINDGFFSEDFPNQGRTFANEYFISESAGVQSILQIYQTIYGRNQDPAGDSIRVLIGAPENEQTVALSRFSRLHEMPIVGYNADDAELADKSVHPYFNRVSIAQGRKFYAMGLFLASHFWTKIIIIKDNEHPIPAIMYEGFEAHGVQVVLEITVPSLPGDGRNFDGVRRLDDDAERIFNSGTRVIFNYAFAPNDFYIYHEAIRLKFAPIFGWQWFTEYSVYLGFPFQDTEGDCGNEPTCTSAFNSTIVLQPGSVADLSQGYWNETLFDAYTHLEPTTTFGSPLYRWPSLLGFNTLSHDAAVAAFLGGMKIINRNETITGAKLALEIRDVRFTGGSGEISFDANGDRPGYSAAIYQMKPVRSNIQISNDFLYLAGYYYVDSDTGEATQVFTRLRSLTTGFTPDFMNFAPSNYTNNRTFLAYWDDTDEPEIFSFEIPAAFYCEGGCGGGLANNTNGTIYYYNYGECIAQGNCRCKNKANSEELGYAGRSCEQILCDPHCVNGDCTQPDVCTCYEGWRGNNCSTPICDPTCENEGVCIRPDVCECTAGFYGATCSDKCTCENGKCADGFAGTGSCTCDSGFTGSACSVSVPLVVVPTTSFFGFIIIGLILFAVWYIRRMRFLAALSNNDWIATYDDLIVVQDDKGGASSMAFRSMASVKSDSKKQKNIVRNQGKWRENLVAVKTINKDSIQLTSPLRLEIKAMRDIRHNNVVQFIGASCEAPNVCILMEIAPKGSLDDLLNNETINLDWNFKFSLLKDVCKGMIYLSSTIFNSHGRLKPSNCVVDNRWTLKITDYGMNLFKSNQHGVPKFVAAEVASEKHHGVEDVEEGNMDVTAKKALIYTAPEILATGVTHLDHVGSGTLEGDIYSYSLIMYEILTKEVSYSEYQDFMEIDELLDCISGRKPAPKMVWQTKEEGSQLMRPKLPEEDEESKGYIELMQKCWSQETEERPNFQLILKQLNSLSPQEGDLMDNLVSMLEKYSTNLEGIVAERTAELNIEKQKTEDLVCRMLPKAIAEQLKQGLQVKAESFDCVTIYFSDIVGFTAIAGDSTPFQVVDLLNDLYTCFDAIIDHYDVYKVETIGDAYMVVSGLPGRNGDNHAGEIASMSLHLLSAILDFQIRHMPDRKLQLRIGMHSGPVVAGVVGLKMPRYCLFGDTVNTASRMESGGFALKVHLSESTALILARLGGYQLDSRGEREVKGKGVMTTYWLTGKEGFNRPLPTDDMAISASKHEFK